MELLSVLSQGPVAIVVAHPDDETLWCFSLLKELPRYRDVFVFCVTYSEGSERGKELRGLADELGFSLEFGNVTDTGLGVPLSESELSVGLSLFLNSRTWGLVLTHPPHGGERPHLHHIQVYELVLEMCEGIGCRFGFFSNLPIPPKGGDYRVFRLRVDPEEKERYLRRFGSQWEFLRHYRFFREGEEFVHIANCPPCLGLSDR